MKQSMGIPPSITEIGGLESQTRQNNLPGTEADLDLPMGPGVSYRIRLAAFTLARGPFSEGVIQMTYPLPPSFSSGPPIIVPGVGETKNTIALQLPFVNTTQFR